MPICITCSTPVRHLYTTYSKADDRSLGKGVRLTQCPNCKRFADKYVEHDFVVLFIDLVLIKPQVYRHLLFNRLGRSDDKLDPSILRLGTLLVLFDVYITWARIERLSTNTPTPSSSSSSASRLSDMPILTQYLFFLTMNVLATLAQHGIIRLLVRSGLGTRRQSGSPGATGAGSSPLPSAVDGTGAIPAAAGVDRSPNPLTTPTSSPYSPTPTLTQNTYSQSTTQTQVQTQSSSSASDKQTRYTVGPGSASPSAISTALLVSSCTKLFPILLVIWPTDSSGSSSTMNKSTFSGLNFATRASNYIGWAVLLNNIEALLILLDCGYVVATTLAVAGVAARWLIEGWALSIVGLGGTGERGFGMPFSASLLLRYVVGGG